MRPYRRAQSRANRHSCTPGGIGHALAREFQSKGENKANCELSIPSDYLIRSASSRDCAAEGDYRRPQRAGHHHLGR
jgi:hypothetical protein